MMAIPIHHDAIMTPSSFSCLVVEDEPAMRKFIRVGLEASQFRVLLAETRKEGIEMFVSHNPDVVLLDLGLPDGDGLDLIKTVREFSGTPIVVLSARGLESDKVNALDAGADDYLTKPFGMPELMARVRAVQRRQLPVATSPTLSFGDLTIELANRRVTKNGELVHLTPIEYSLLTMFVKHPDKVLTHRMLLESVWGPSYVRHNHYVRVHVAELRKKIEADPVRPKHLVTESGVGYRWMSP